MKNRSQQYSLSTAKRTVSSKHSDSELLSDRQIQRVLWVLLLGGTVVSFSNSALNPAIPVFMSVFSVDIVMGGWVLNGYVLAMSVGLMLSGYLSKVFDFKRIYNIATIGFMAGSVVGMLASSMAFIIVARAIQGLAGGLIIPLSIGLLYQLYPSNRQGRVMALWGIVIMVSLALGPLVGAYLVARFEWWVLFAITLPLSLLVTAMTLWWMPLLPISQAQQDKDKSFDRVGFIALVAWLMALTLWLNALKSPLAIGVSSDFVQWLFVVAFIITFGIWWRYEQQHLSPLLKVDLLANKTYLHSIILSIIQTLGLMMGLLFLPIIIQEVMHKSAMWTGGVLMVATLIASITTHIAGKTVDRYGARGIGSTGVIISGVAMLLLACSLFSPNIWLIMLIMSIHGVGVGLAYLPTTTAGLGSLDKHQVTDGAALNNISRRIVSTIFITLATLYINNGGLGLLAHLLPVLIKLGLFSSMSPHVLASTLSNLLSNPLITSMQEVFIGLGVMLLVTVISARKLPLINS